MTVPPAASKGLRLFSSESWSQHDRTNRLPWRRNGGGGLGVQPRLTESHEAEQQEAASLLPWPSHMCIVTAPRQQEVLSRWEPNEMWSTLDLCNQPDSYNDKSFLLGVTPWTGNRNLAFSWRRRNPWYHQQADKNRKSLRLNNPAKKCRSLQ